MKKLDTNECGMPR